MDRLKKSLLEVIVIVFSVLLATWLENLRQRNEDQAVAKEFLLGLRGDLLNDISEMKTDITSYSKTRLGFRYFGSLSTGGEWNTDSINKYRSIFYNTTELLPNNGGYEGFKSSGKMYSIENRKLRTEILDLYQESIPLLLKSTELYIEKKHRLAVYFEDNQRLLKDGVANDRDLILSPKIQNLCNGLTYIDEIVDRYNRSITLSESIISTIEKEYAIPADSSADAEKGI
jgi:hypothetical protein